MHQCDYLCWYYNSSCDCPYTMKKRACENALKIKEKNDMTNEVSSEDIERFNYRMKEVIQDYKTKQAKTIQSAKNIVIS